jgi:hypothetical protein
MAFFSMPVTVLGVEIIQDSMFPFLSLSNANLQLYVTLTPKNFVVSLQRFLVAHDTLFAEICVMKFLEKLCPLFQLGKLAGGIH